MHKNIITRVFLLLALIWMCTANVFAQEHDPNSPFRKATDTERELHDTVYKILQQEIVTKICGNDWAITKSPFLISNHPDEMIVVKNYYKGYSNIPVFTRENETFKISLNKQTPLYQKYIDSMNMPPVNYNTVTRISNEMQFADITLLLNESHTDKLKGKILQKIPGIQQTSMYEEKLDESVPYSTYTAELYIGSWPKLSREKELQFGLKKYTDGPVIENMKITISAKSYQKLMKVIHRIDWTKLEAMVKK